MKNNIIVVIDKQVSIYDIKKINNKFTLTQYTPDKVVNLTNLSKANVRNLLRDKTIEEASMFLPEPIDQMLFLCMGEKVYEFKRHLKSGHYFKGKTWAAKGYSTLLAAHDVINIILDSIQEEKEYEN